MDPHDLSEPELPAIARERPDIELPDYDRTQVRPGIVHLGVGGFHRAHQAVVVDDLLRQGTGQDWGIIGVGVLPGDAAMRDALDAQDRLYTLVRKHPDGTLDARVIGSIIDYLLASDDPERVVELLADPAIRIVSLTITEGGYGIDPISGEFDAGADAVRADLEPGAAPRTVFGLVTAGLARRRERGIPPFTVMSCDNIPGNGGVARRAFSSFAALVDPGLGRFIAEEVAFPNSMVDRITPVTTAEDRALVAERFGIADRWPVVAEPFFQWVLEDRFPLGRPAFESAGVQLVDDVEPYELMKLRLLNASHQGMAYAGSLIGYRYAHEAVADPAIRELLRDYMQLEARPTLRPVPGIDLDDYIATLLTRFANPAIRDTLARLCAETSDRIPKFLLPVVRERLAAGGDVRRSAAIVATWARYAEGVDEAGEPIQVVDRDAAELTRIARTQRDDPTAFIANRRYFGDLVDDDRFRVPYLAALASLHEHGAAATVRSLAG
jgi:mannitol 2-dehydrogenase